MSTLRPVKVMISGATPATASRQSTISTSTRKVCAAIGQDGGSAASNRVESAESGQGEQREERRADRE